MAPAILTYGHPILRRPTYSVADLTAELDQLIDDMVATMYAAPGVGLAANQVGSRHRLFVANPSEDQDPRTLVVMINPELVASEGEAVIEEGCLSIPDLRENVPRARRVVVRGLNRVGRPIQIETEGLLARIFQHELDHLNGVLFVDRLSPAKRDMLHRKLKKALRDR